MIIQVTADVPVFGVNDTAMVGSMEVNADGYIEISFHDPKEASRLIQALRRGDSLSASLVLGTDENA